MGFLLRLDLFPNETRAIGDQSIHHMYIGSVDHSFEIVCKRHILWHVEVCLDPGRGRIRRKRARRVARRRHRQMFEPVMLRHGDRHCEPPCLEAAGRVVSFFLDVQDWITLRLHHRRPALAERHGRHVRQHITIAPHAERSRRSSSILRGIITMRRTLQLVHVVANIEALERRGIERLRGLGGEAIVAANGLEISNLRHMSMLTEFVQRSLAGARWARRASLRRPGMRQSRHDDAFGRTLRAHGGDRP